jgi:hypothetical protein
MRRSATRRERPRAAHPARPVLERRVRPRPALVGRARGRSPGPGGVWDERAPPADPAPDVPAFALRRLDGPARARRVHARGAPGGARGAELGAGRWVRPPARGRHRTRSGRGRRGRRGVHHGRAGPPARVRPQPGLPRRGFLRRLPSAVLRGGRPTGLLLDRALPRGVLHPQRHERRGALCAADLPGGFAAVARLFYGSPQPQIQAFRAFRISNEFQERYGYPALTRDLKAKVLGRNAARLYGIDPVPARCDFTRRELATIREELRDGDRLLGPATFAASADVREHHRMEVSSAT